MASELLPLNETPSSENSRFRFSNVYEGDLMISDSSSSLSSKWGRQKFLGMWTAPDIPTSDQDVYHRVTPADEYRLDLISYRYYSTVDLGWIIVLANDLIDPIQDVTVGKVLTIPSASTVFNRVLI